MSAPARGLLLLVVFVIALLPFLPALQAGFVNWDDQANFVNNPHFRGLGATQLRWMWTATLLGHYIPLTWMSLGLNYLLGGLSPFGYHLGNLLLHAATAALFYLVARRLLAAAASPGGPALEWPAVLAALVFAVHPLRTESVAWVTERRDVLSGLFYLAAVLAYLRGTEHGGPLSGRWRSVSLVAFAAGLLSKSIVMTLPATLLLLDLYPLRRRRLGWRRLLGEKAGHLALAAAGAGVALWAVAQVSGITRYGRYGLEARLAMVGYSLWFHPSRLLWATDLSPLHELPAVVELSDPRFLAPCLAVLAVTALLVALARRWPAGLAAWAQSAIALAPVAGVVHAGHQLTHDRYSYLSGMGFAVLVGGGLAWLLVGARSGRHPRWLAVAGAAAGVAVVLALAGNTWRQSATWRTSESLWRAAIAADPGCALCTELLARSLIESGHRSGPRSGEAAALFLRAIALRPDRRDPYYNLASLLVWQKRYAEAEAVLRTYRRTYPEWADPRLRLGMLARDRGRPGDAILHLREALRLEPGLGPARRELALALRERASELDAAGRGDEARPLRREAEILGPGPAAGSVR